MGCDVLEKWAWCVMCPGVELRNFAYMKRQVVWLGMSHVDIGWMLASTCEKNIKRRVIWSWMSNVKIYRGWTRPGMEDSKRRVLSYVERQRNWTRHGEGALHACWKLGRTRPRLEMFEMTSRCMREFRLDMRRKVACYMEDRSDSTWEETSYGDKG